MPQNINYNPEKILAKVNQSIVGIKQVPKWHSQLISILYFAATVVFLIISIILWLVFTDQVKTNLIFASVVGYNISGWFWLWFPEIPLLSIISILAMFFIYKSRDFLGYKYIDFASFAIVLVFVIGSIFYLKTPVNALASLNLIENIKQSANQSSYRLYWRDKHIEDLKNKNEFYGAVTAIDAKNLSIDHAGVILDFQCSILSCNQIKTGDLLWVRFNLLNGNKTIQSLEVLK